MRYVEGCVPSCSEVRRLRSRSNEQIVDELGMGLLILLGFSTSDVEVDEEYLAEKTVGLRIFEDDDGKMNRNVADIGGELLAVSQFTLYGDVRRGSADLSTTRRGPS